MYSSFYHIDFWNQHIGHQFQACAKDDMRRIRNLPCGFAAVRADAWVSGGHPASDRRSDSLWADRMVGF